METMLSQQKRRILAEERILLDGLYTFIQNQVGGVLGSTHLLEERLSKLEPPPLQQESFWARLFSVQRRIAQATSMQKQIGSELSLIKEMLQENQTGLQKLKKGLSDFAAFTKLTDPLMQTLFLNEVVEEVLQQLTISIKKNQINMRKEWVQVPPILADREMVKLALTEVAINAIEVQPEGGELTISCQPDLQLEQLILTVRDRGPGVPRHLAEKIFYPFFTTKEGHSGLGLTRALHWTSLNNGSIETRVDAGGGEFSFRFPIQKVELNRD
jgi:signal transduction histidine kinase